MLRALKGDSPAAGDCPRRRCRIHRAPISGLAIAVGVLLSTFAGGCFGPSSDYKRAVAENTELKAKLHAAQQKNEDLQQTVVSQSKQIETLIGLGGKRLEMIPHTAKIELGSYTGGYYTDVTKKEKGQDAVKVYLMPIDPQGSVIKAPGSVSIRVFDLAAPEGKSLLGECSFNDEQVAKNWYSGVLSAYHYSFVCPFKTQPQHDEVTIRVEFTDYITGQHFTQTKTAKVELPAKQ